MKFTLIFLFLLTRVFASLIPTYQIQSVANGVIELTNGAEFEARPRDTGLLRIFNSAHPFRLAIDRELFRPQDAAPINGRPVAKPFFYFVDDTNDRVRIGSSLKTPPSNLGVGTYTITAIDLVGLTITLSNGSVWDFDPEEVTRVSQWQLGQFVMIGQETIPLIYFDAVLFNTQMQNAISALEH